MPLTTYTYSIASDTANGEVIGEVLADEIALSTITEAVDSVNTSGDVLDIIMKDALDAGEVTTLDGIVAAHTALLAEPPTEVRILEEDPARRTGGNYMALGLKHEVPAGNGTSSTTFSYPIPIGLIDFEYVVDANMEDDEMCIMVAPETVTGALTADVTAGDTVINVSPTVTANVKVGYKIHLDDGTNKDDLGIVTAISLGGGTITVETAAVNNFLAATPTYVKQSVYLAKDVRLNGTVAIEMGAAKIGASYLPANTPWSIEYHNNEGSAKTFSGILEILY